MDHPIRWQHFEPATRKAAVAANRPILLLLTMPWCQHSRDLLASFRDPQIVRLVGETVVPVHVDAQRRPDVDQRYGAGTWPTIAWLTPDGETIAKDGWLDVAGLRDRIEWLRAAWQRGERDIRRGLRDTHARRGDGPTPRQGRLRREMVDDIAESILGKYDAVHGGFGDGTRFPHPEAIDFALIQASKRGDPRMADVVTRTLDRLLASPMHDRVGGGFFRFSRTPDWQSPNFEKLLDQNALVLRALLEAHQVFGNESYRDAAAGIVRWMSTTMLDPATGAFAGSEHGGSDQFADTAAERAARPPATIDRTVFCHANALAVSALLKAAAVLEQPGWRAQAMATLRFVLGNLFDGQDVHHYWDGTYHLPGLVSDQALLIRALIDASQNTGDADLLLPAEAIAARVLARNKAPTGGFVDALDDRQGAWPARRRNRSILDNATMAESLMRLSFLSRRPEFRREAIAALESFADDYREYGYYVAGYGRAVDLVFYEPLFLTIVGDRDGAALQELRRTALATYVPSRIVQTLDPRHDPILLARSGLAVEAGPVVHLAVGDTPHGAARTPAELLVAIEAIEAERRAKLA